MKKVILLTLLIAAKVVLNAQILVDFGAKESSNVYKIEGWKTPIMDQYTKYLSVAGISGTNFSIASATAGSENDFQGIKGTAKKMDLGDKIAVSWYNNSKQTVTFSPKISFNDPNRANDDYSGSDFPKKGTWYKMQETTIKPNSSGISYYEFDNATAGDIKLVNVNVNIPKDIAAKNPVNGTLPDHYKGFMICDKIEYIPFDQNAAPKADFNVNITQGNAPLEVQFADASSTTTNAWEWDFGDGNSSNEQNPKHIYNDAGNYTVKLKVTNTKSNTSDEITKSEFIKVTEPSSGGCGSLSTVLGEVVKVASAEEFKKAITDAIGAGGNRTILIKDGTYVVTSSGWYPFIDANNLVIRSESGNRDKVILKGHGMRPNASGEHIFYLKGNNITIADITIGECGGHGVSINPTQKNILIHNVRIFNTYEQMIKANKNKEGVGSENVTVECCKMEYTANQAPYYYTAGVDSHNGINWIVRNNTIKNVRRPNGQLTEHAIHFWSGSKNGIIEKNTIINCDRGIGLGLGENYVSGFLVKNNMVHTSRDVGIAIESSPNSEIYNNTFYTENYSNSIEYRYAATKGTKIYNNLSNKIIKQRDGGIADVKNNISNSQSSWFVNPTKGDMHLKDKNADIVDKGIKIAKVTDDFDGNARPQGSAYDIGADEFIQTTELTADFSSDVTSGNAPLTVKFTDASTGNPTSWKWDFDNDGKTDASTQNPQYVYPKSGTYTVTLTVNNANGSKSKTKTDYITVKSPTGIFDSEENLDVIKIYPNPAKDFLFVASNVEEVAHIYNAEGKRIKTFMLRMGRNEINISDLPTGVYIIKLKSNNFRFVKQ